jgi:hypothetical protein
MRKLLHFIIIILCHNCIGQNTTKPWAYWWWPASAVNKEDIASNLKQYADAGFGGMHIIPIYGVKGEEAKYITFLSPQWLNILDFTCKEAAKNGMGIDMTLGTGWPFGGPWISEKEAAKKLEIRNYKFISTPTLQKVKRAAPGGVGLVLDHFNKEAAEKYFSKFDSIFSTNNYGVRAFYNDSYEVYGANWTDNLPQKFKELRGYNITDHVSALEKKANFTKEELRIRADYQETISDLVLTSFTKTYADFGIKYNKLTRNEAHGSPANILDLYATTSIPETEFFGSKPFKIPFYRQDPNYDESRYGKPNWKVMKLASSPAHIYNKPLVSSETATWLADHFKVTLAQIKPVVDESFLGGVNHIFYHGVTYSPPAAEFPGWLFYASTNFNPQSHFWKELPLLNKYINRCQTILQNSKADNEILVYLPFYDFWHKPSESVTMIDIHNIQKSGLFTSKFLALLDKLKENGYQFDFVSDKQIAELTRDKNKKFGIKNFTYQALIIPEIDVLPDATLKRLNQIKDKGLKVIFENKLPTQTNGYHNFSERQLNFEKLIKEWKVENNIISSLKKMGLKGENLSQQGLEFLRKTNAKGTVYYIVNHGNTLVNTKLKLTKNLPSSVVYDPLSGKEGAINLNKQEIYLPPGRSIFIYNNEKITTLYADKNPTNKIDLSQDWQLNVCNTNHTLPSLKSWTTIDVDTLQYYHGIGTYTKEFVISEKEIDASFTLYMGEVQASAEVFINDKKIGTTWCLPHMLSIPKGVLQKNNILKIVIKNSSFNKVRKLDKDGVPWKKFHDINMVNIKYESFDASNYPAEVSGLLGPVELRY